MAKTDPFHTTTPESGNPRHRDVYHDQDMCFDGIRILEENRVAGTGGRSLCDECKSLR